MRKKNYNIAALAICACLVVLTSCSKAFRFNNSTIVPAASGKVNVKKDRNKNYSVKVTVNNLADPQDIRQPGSMYVVWMETSGNGTKNLGRLRSSKKISGALKASMKTVTSFEPTRFFITAEENAAVQYPDSRYVLQTDRIR